MSTRETKASRDQLWQRLTLLVLVLTGLAALFYLAAFFSPSLLSGIVPAGGATPTRAVVLSTPAATFTPSATETPIYTWTPRPSRTPRPTETPSSTPTLTHTPGPTPTFPPTWTPVQPTGSPVPTRSNYPFALRNNEIIYTQYYFSPDCNWLGIAGLVRDKEDNPIIGMPVVLNGGGLENIIAYSGNAPGYGESGWEHFLDNRVKEGDFTVQLYNNQGEPVSDQIQVRTRADCRANLIMIVFEQNWEEYVP